MKRIARILIGIVGIGILGIVILVRYPFRVVRVTSSTRELITVSANPLQNQSPPDYLFTPSSTYVNIEALPTCPPLPIQDNQSLGFTSPTPSPYPDPFGIPKCRITDKTPGSFVGEGSPRLSGYYPSISPTINNPTIPVDTPFLKNP